MSELSPLTTDSPDLSIDRVTAAETENVSLEIEASVDAGNPSEVPFEDAAKEESKHGVSGTTGAIPSESSSNFAAHTAALRPLARPDDLKEAPQHVLDRLAGLIHNYDSGMKSELAAVEQQFQELCARQQAAFENYASASDEAFQKQYDRLRRHIEPRGSGSARGGIPALQLSESCGRGTQLWNKKSTTLFGRQFQYLRGHDLFTAHFLDEFDLNFRFTSPQERHFIWKRYHPNGKQWRSLQNLAIRKICRRHMYKAPPPVKSDELVPYVDYRGYEVCEGWDSAPELSIIEHEEIWAGFENLGECHYEWSKICFRIWHEYECILYRGDLQKTKKHVEREILQVDSVIADFVPTCNTQGYVMLMPDGSTFVPAPQTTVPCTAAAYTNPGAAYSNALFNMHMASMPPFGLPPPFSSPMGFMGTAPLQSAQYVGDRDSGRGSSMSPPDWLSMLPLPSPNFPGSLAYPPTMTSPGQVQC